MAPINKLPLKDYISAFAQFTDASELEFQIRRETGALALFEDETYRICIYADLVHDFKSYFEPDYTLIYTETPFVLWEVFFDRHHKITDEDFIIDIFNAWSIFWDSQKIVFASKHVYEASKAQSRKEFADMIKQLQSNPRDFIKNAIEISDMTLIPVIALALRSRFESEELFYNECMDILLEVAPHMFGRNGNFDEVDLNIIGKGLITFYIFQPDYEFEM